VDLRPDRCTASLCRSAATPVVRGHRVVRLEHRLRTRPGYVQGGNPRGRRG
jgi:hypothetical protein